MKTYSKSDINNIYFRLKTCAEKSLQEGRYDDALVFIKSAASWMSQFNAFYSDVEADAFIRKIAEQVFSEKKIENPSAQKCILIDSWGWDHKGLSQQYINGLINIGLEILYICTRKDEKRGSDIQKCLKDCGKAEIFYADSKRDALEAARKIRKKIVVFSPASIFLHITPYDTAALMACSGLEGVKILNINLTDHAFWLGSSLIDYNIEFRPYGMTVSQEKRALIQKQLLPLPYYPIKSLSHPYQGLPNLPQNAIKVFTGGALYKMLGKDDIFFKIMESVLKISSSVYILVAGFAEKRLFEEKCKNLYGSERILLIGNRSDIDEVFEHIDIYLSTYPMIGGLMSQYAAMHGKPIIAYREKGDIMNEVEEIINNFQQSFHSCTSISDMIDYATKLIHDVKFRQAEGKILKEGLMTPQRFDDLLSCYYKDQGAKLNWEKDEIDYDSFFERYLELENKSGFKATEDLVAKLKWKAFFSLKGYRLNLLEKMLVLSYKKIIKYKIISICQYLKRRPS